MNRSKALNRNFNRLTSFIKITAIPTAAVFAFLVSGLIWFYRNLSPQNEGPQWLAMTVALCIIALGAMHLILLAALWISSRTSEKPNFIRSAAIALGCVSLVSLAVSIVALSDIGHQNLAGLDSSGEWTLLLINNVIHLIFLALAFPSLPVFGKKPSAPFILNDDILFVTINEVGLISAIMAVCAIVFGFTYPIMIAYREAVVLIFTLIALAPWGLMLIGWFLSRRKKISSWWDEKQIQDMSRSALFSLPIIVMSAIAVFVIQWLFPAFDTSIMWLPVVVVISVLSFSSFNVGFSR